VSRRPLANLLSATTTDAPASAPATAGVDRSASGPSDGRFSPGRFYAGLAIVALIVGALSLLIPSTPSYDPWSWLVWGREIVHINLQTTGGPTWKPLPVIFTTVFALFGKAEPDLWLAVARAGALAAVVMVFRLSFRLTRQIGSYFTPAAAHDPGRLVRLAPALLAGLIAAVGLALSGGFISDNAMGYSEGLATAVILIAAERHLDGRPRQAFAVGFLAALDRPEIWLFWGPYGLWLFYRDAGARKLVIGLFVLIPILWFLPEYWGSGHFLRGVSRAQRPRANSNAHAKCPFCAELVKSAWPTILLRIKAAAAVLVIVVGTVTGRGWRRERAAALASSQSHAQVAAAGAGIVGLAWFVLIAVMTQIGFSGNNRYLVIGSALVEICGAVAWGWAAQEIANLVRGGLAHGRATATATVARASGWAGAVIAAAAFVLLPGWIGPNLINIPKTHGSLVYQAHLREGAADVVASYGGAAKLLRCGTVMTEGFQVPLVAWTLGIHTMQILSPPPAGAPPGQAIGEDPGPAPNVILQTRASRNLTRLPIVHSWPTVPYVYAGHNGPFRLFTHCHG